MNIAKSPLVRPAKGIVALFALGCAFSLAFVSTPTAKAADSTTLQRLAADTEPALPLTATFEKVADSERGPFVLKLTNDSKETIKASAKILLAVAFHADNKARNIPEHAIEPGQVWAIDDLVANDKVVITAAGFAPLELVVK